MPKTVRKKLKKMEGIPTVKNPPNNWRKMWDGICKMRCVQNAPVDSMGAHTSASSLSADLHHTEDQKFQILVGCFLSSMTKDQQTSQAVNNLKENLTDGLTISSILNTSEDLIDEQIKMVGFHRKKAKNLKIIANIVHKDYNDVMPLTLDVLLLFPGVGYKMAFLYLQIVTGVAVGIAVDTHVHRISNRLGWCKSSSPEQSRMQLQSWLPREHWAEINVLFVGFGQQICEAKSPKCTQCSIKYICPTGKGKRKDVKRKIKTKDRSKEKEDEETNEYDLIDIEDL